MGIGSGSVVDPPVLDLRGWGGGSGWVELVRTRNDIEAHLLAGRLQEAGIKSRLVKDRGAPGAWLYGGSNPWAPVTVWVRTIQFEDAHIVLAEVALDGPPAARPAPAARRRALLVWWAAALILGAVFTGIGLHRAQTTVRCTVPILCG